MYNWLRVRYKDRGRSLHLKYVYFKEYCIFTGWRYGPKEPDGYAENTLVTFSAGSPQSYKKWTNVIDDFLSGNKPSGQQIISNCIC